jgi:hypothetical protein
MACSRTSFTFFIFTSLDNPASRTCEMRDVKSSAIVCQQQQAAFLPQAHDLMPFASTILAEVFFSVRSHTFRNYDQNHPFRTFVHPSVLIKFEHYWTAFVKSDTAMLYGNLYNSSISMLKRTVLTFKNRASCI